MARPIEGEYLRDNHRMTVKRIYQLIALVLLHLLGQEQSHS